MENADSVESHHPYKLFASFPSGLSRAQVEVVFDESYDRIPHPDLNLENSIAEIWNHRVQGNGSLFNGKKFRYGGLSLKSKEGSNQEKSVSLHLGLTDYRTFVGTNLSPQWEKFMVASEDDSERCKHSSSPLGNGAVIETFDKKVVVLQRSNNVGEFPGHFVFPGGHPEPQEVGIETHQYGKNTVDSKILNEKVSEEMFDSIIREVVEEIGVPAASLSDPIFIGVSRRVLNDGYESTQLYAVPMDELENMTSKMPGCHQGAFALYKLMVEASKNT